MKPKKRKLTQKERALVKALPSCLSQGEAAITAGYSPKNPDQSAYQALKSIRKNLEAREIKFFASEGVVMDEREVAAWGPRMQALQLAGNWRGLGRDHEAEGVNTGSAGDGITVRLEFIDTERARVVAATIAARRPGSRLVDMDAPLDADAGR
jgi:hypothetical protein